MLTKKRLILLVLLLIFMLPGLSAYWLYQHAIQEDARRVKTTNKGQLLAPPVLLAKLPKTAKWGLLVWSEGPCEEACSQALDRIIRIRLALGRRFYQVNLWLVTQDKKNDPAAYQKQGISSVLISMPDSIKLLKNSQNDAQIFLVDPRNFLVLTYPASVDPDDVYSDLKKVMNVPST